MFNSIQFSVHRELKLSNILCPTEKSVDKHFTEKHPWHFGIYLRIYIKHNKDKKQINKKRDGSWQTLPLN